jgi:methionyl-tRNA synthetase
METILNVISNQIINISILLNPIIPEATSKTLNTMNIDIKNIKIDSINDLNIIKHDKELKNLEILFKKIDNDN